MTRTTNTTDESESNATPARDAAELLALLLGSMQDDGPGPTTFDLCREHGEDIQRRFGEWLDAAEGLRENRSSYHRHLNHLYVISKMMSDNLGVPLFSQLVEAGRENTFARWERTLEQGQALVRQLRLSEAASLLCDHLIDKSDLREFGYRHLAATTHWYISQAHLHAGRRDDAVGHGERSLAITREIQDHPKYHVRYHEHLLETHRYFGESSVAAGYAAALASMFDEFHQPERAGDYRRRERLLNDGEPPVRAVVRINGKVHELDELTDRQQLAGEHTRAEIILVRNRMTLLPSLMLTAEAQRLHGEDKLAEAMATLSEAAAADRHDPEPLRLAGYHMLSHGECAGAAEAFAEAERRAPRWHQSGSGYWLATQLLCGRYPDTLLRVVQFVQAEDVTVGDRLEVATKAVAEHPDVAILRMNHGLLLRKLGRLAEAEETLKVALECECDDNLKTRLLVELAQVYDAGDRRRQLLLEDAVRLNGDLAAAAGARILLLATKV
jgi:tetratricopeptide (TPR) repeat protein